MKRKINQVGSYRNKRKAKRTRKVSLLARVKKALRKLLPTCCK